MQKYIRLYLLTVIGVLLFFPSIASASWQSPYMGIYSGIAFGENQATTNAGTVTSNSYLTSTIDIQNIQEAGSKDGYPALAILGINAGHDWQFNQLIYGIILDYGALPLNTTKSSSESYIDGDNQFFVSTTMSTNWLFTLRGRLGYETTQPLTFLFNRPNFIYLTGGMALAELKVKNNFSDNTSLQGTGGISTSQNQIGWAVGVGIELFTCANTTVNLEYLYVNLPSLKAISTITNSEAGFGIPAESLNNAFITKGTFDASIVKFALNYRFSE